MTGQLSRFLTVGAFNTALGYAVIFTCMYGFCIGAEASNAIGYAVGLICSFLLSRTFTFRSVGRRTGEILRFLVSFAIAYGLNLVFLSAMTRWFGVHAGVAQVLAGVVYVIASYYLNDRYVFRKSSRQAP